MGQSWDASVKALTELPSVLDNMAKNLARIGPRPRSGPEAS
jgi:hypothetical protein